MAVRSRTHGFEYVRFFSKDGKLFLYFFCGGARKAGTKTNLRTTGVVSIRAFGHARYLLLCYVSRLKKK